MLMDSNFFLTVVAAVIGFFTLFGTPVFMVYRKIRLHQEKQKSGFYSYISPPSSSSYSSPPSSSSPRSSLSSSSSSSLPSSFLTSSLSCKWTHDVFPSFRGEDIRINFLSHIKKEFRRKGITPFIDNNIKRGEFIGPEIVLAIKRSKIAIVILSEKYASSKWCLNELMEIMKSKKESGQIVFAIFYEVDPSDVKKLTGEFGAIFKKTCAGQTKEEIGRWRQAFVEVATIAGYDSRNWDDEAVMIEEIVHEISKRLINSSPSKYFEGLAGMETYTDEMQSLICLESNEVRMIGILGPPGIGKTTIARVIHSQISGGFELSAFMDMKSSYRRPTCSDDYKVKLHLMKQLLSQLFNQEVSEITHLEAAHNLLMKKKVLIVLDGVDQLEQLLAMPKVRYLGPGSRIIITTQNQKLLNAVDITRIYNVSYPPVAVALQIFCINAFGQNTPFDGFEKLAWEVITRVGKLPLVLRVMGFHLRGMSKQEWKAELPNLRVRLDGEIGSILKLSYDFLNDEEKDLFLHIACFFNRSIVRNVEDIVGHRFSEHVFCALWERSLISDQPRFPMNESLAELGREIVRNQFIDEPGKRRFLDDVEEIFQVLTDDTGSRSIIGIDLNMDMIASDQYISEKAFEEMNNLELLRFRASSIVPRMHFPRLLNCLPPKLRLLHWELYPMKSLPSRFVTKFLVNIEMKCSQLEKLWEGIQPLGNLKLMNLDRSYYLKEIPDLSTATNLRKLSLRWCQSLVKLPFSIGNATNLQTLNLHGCSIQLELPLSIRNLTNLQKLNLNYCLRMTKVLSSIENLTNLQTLGLNGFSSLVKLPSTIEKNLQAMKNIMDSSWLYREFYGFTVLYDLEGLPSGIGNLINLQKLYIHGCSMLVKLPSSIGNLVNLQSLDFEGCSNLVELPYSIGDLVNLQNLDLEGCSSMVELPSSIGDLVNLQNLDLQGCSSVAELPYSIGNLVNLENLDLKGCSSLVHLPSSIGNLVNLTIWISRGAQVTRASIFY